MENKRLKDVTFLHTKELNVEYINFCKDIFCENLNSYYLP